MLGQKQLQPDNVQEVYQCVFSPTSLGMRPGPYRSGIFAEKRSHLGNL